MLVHIICRYKLIMDVEDETGGALITGFGESIKNLMGINVEDMMQISFQPNGVEQIERLFDLLVGKTTTFLIQIKDWNFENSDATSYTAIMITTIPEIKILSEKLLKTHQLGPHTPVKKERKTVINLDDDPEEMSNKKQKKIKQEPED
ncbi:hypothetical protein AQUCO_15600004v1 [Aquilegia coerulea]|uniref:Replication factor A C-terminal domain-containing protein n=1 Tax=Aquilegia coerulea TaxID=218851 RepID=A0A2G5C0S1_AQUCA|nr:hypothetical protein AQUCO_15600004v1 [Aquilegia coerulea]